MLLSSAHVVTTGARLRQFVLDLLRVRGLTQPATGRQGPALDAYLSSLWHVAHSYQDRPFEFYFMAELLEKAFDYPPMPYDWEPELRQPYRPTPDHLAPCQTPAHAAEGDTYAYFEQVVKRQIGELKRIFRLPNLPEHDAPSVLDGQRVYWLNLFVEPFLERATTGLEEALEPEQEATWGYFASLLKDGQHVD
jgi:hypothetical protein